MEKAKNILKNFTFCEDVYEVDHGNDVLLIVTEWEEFKHLKLYKLKKLLKYLFIIDRRNIYEPERARRFGFKYVVWDVAKTC